MLSVLRLIILIPDVFSARDSAVGTGYYGSVLVSWCAKNRHILTAPEHLLTAPEDL